LLIDLKAAYQLFHDSKDAVSQVKVGSSSNTLLWMARRDIGYRHATSTDMFERDYVSGHRTSLRERGAV
jgi:hypothetical protein